jgi:hypothetical protein
MINKCPIAWKSIPTYELSDIVFHMDEDIFYVNYSYKNYIFVKKTKVKRY